MKKTIISFCLFAGLFCLFSAGSFAGMGRVDTSNFFIDNTNVNVITVLQAKKLSDKSPITLEGYLVRQIDDDEFIFRDSSGEIRIDIDDNVMYQFANARITPNTLVRIQGSLDKEMLEETTADIFKLEIVRQ